MRRSALMLVACSVFLGLVTFAHADSPVLGGVCSGWPSPQVTLNWNLPAHRDVNAIEKGPHPNYLLDTTGTVPFYGFISDNGSGAPHWGQAPVGYNQSSYVDANISPGTTYTWRIKAHATGPGARSNLYVVTINSCNCGGGCPATDNATVAITAPTTATTNQLFSVTFLANNTGTTVWTPVYSAAATNGANSAVWSAVSSVPSVNVSPGGSLIRTVPFTAPATPGTYPITPWRMMSGTGFFGSGSPTVSVVVAAPNQPATGQSEIAACSGLTGWARDPDTATPLAVRIYRDGVMGTGTLVATVTANGAHAAPQSGYGYTWVPPIDGVPHTYHLYAQDPQDFVWYPLLGSPTASVVCSPAPSVTLTTVTQGDYCSGGPQLTANWQYASTGGHPQTQWQIQVATDPGFASVVVDSGITPTAPTLTPPSSHMGGTGQGILQFSTTYWVRVQSWDSLGTPSGWSAPLSALTAVSAYPVASFTSTPSQIFAQQPVQFTDTTTNSPTTWAWDFGDGQVDSVQNPVHTFAAEGSYAVSLAVTNGAGTCSVIQNVGAGKALPNYREVRPGGNQ